MSGERWTKEEFLYMFSFYKRYKNEKKCAEELIEGGWIIKRSEDAIIRKYKYVLEFADKFNIPFHEIDASEPRFINIKQTL